MTKLKKLERSLDSKKVIPYTMRKYYPCNFCGKVFNQVPNLENHIRIHTKERPYKCDKCSYTAAQISHIGVHERSRVAGSDVIPCSETGCDLVFCTIQLLQRHKIIDHSVSINSRIKPKGRMQASSLLTAIMTRKWTRSMTRNSAINTEVQTKSVKTHTRLRQDGQHGQILTASVTSKTTETGGITNNEFQFLEEANSYSDMLAKRAAMDPTTTKITVKGSVKINGQILKTEIST